MDIKDAYDITAPLDAPGRAGPHTSKLTADIYRKYTAFLDRLLGHGYRLALRDLEGTLTNLGALIRCTASPTLARMEIETARRALNEMERALDAAEELFPQREAR